MNISASEVYHIDAFTFVKMIRPFVHLKNISTIKNIAAEFGVCVSKLEIPVEGVGGHCVLSFPDGKKFDFNI